MDGVNWSHEAIKVGLVSAAIALFFATRLPQTPEMLTPWLAGKGYSQISIDGPVERCGRSRHLFQFRAQAGDGAPVSGAVCMGDYRWEYRLTLTR